MKSFYKSLCAKERELFPVKKFGGTSAPLRTYPLGRYENINHIYDYKGRMY